MLFAIPQHSVKSPDTGRYQIVRLEQIEVIVINTQVDVLPAFLALFDEAGRQTPAPSVDNGSTFFTLDRRMETQVLSTRKPQTPEIFLLSKLVCAILHESS